MLDKVATDDVLKSHGTGHLAMLNEILKRPCKDNDKRERENKGRIKLFYANTREKTDRENHSLGVISFSKEWL